ncbi:fatty acid desaturase [Halomonas campisalis]|uniref:Fatty acid desaturase n=1 Tax=Billgrantia campisalis TaxID=74661 RepID=A0ABS9P8C3_9GAMM|nr:fatty acid desaturase [Halomonas campisalis]MCG6657457.1 fatty acid desaturase [Halomonas campisalis]MDR5863197.1 fatty acid desaturase [Halomonas campisalis]
MKPQAPNGDITTEPRALMRVLGGYREPRLARSVLEITITVIPFASLWLLLWASLSAGHWLGLLLVVPAAGFLVRLFMILHDCSHGAFFRSKRVNDWVGRVIGVVTLTPYDFWRHTHARHHVNSGNLDRPRLGGIDTLTVREFQSLPRGQRLRYRLYRHPLVLFGLGPAYLFLLDNRLPLGFIRGGWMPWLSTMGTNAAIVVVVAAMMGLVGVGPFLLVHLPIMVLAASIGVWLFYVQHQFEDTFWEHDHDWTFHEAALHGSSYYDLPAVLRWFTANIGVHHVHHLCSRIPFYRLPEVLRDHPELRSIGRLTLRQSLGAVRLSLWDEEKRRLVSFGEARDLPPAEGGGSADRTPRTAQPKALSGRQPAI